MILEKSFKKSSLEESPVKEIQPAKENATLTSAQVYKGITHEHKSMLSLVTTQKCFIVYIIVIIIIFS